MNSQWYRELVTSRRRGVGAALARGLFGAASVPYGWAVELRNRAFDSGRRPAMRVPVPVVSVGNLTLGGTGKTPLVEYLARWFGDQGLRVAILSRGYGASAVEESDEAAVLRHNLTDVPHLQGADRVALARRAVEDLAAEILVLDDGFQHRRLARDLDIVVLDALDPFGGERLFPRGLLREPLKGLRRADLVVLSRADLCSEAYRHRIRQRCEKLLRRSGPGGNGRANGSNHPINGDAPMPWIEVAQRPQCWLDVHGRSLPLAALEGQRVAAFCGIGNPAGFRRTLELLDVSIVGFREFADHQVYRSGDVNGLLHWARGVGATALVTTQKDWVKLRERWSEGLPLWALRIEVEVLSGSDLFEGRLRALAERAARCRPETAAAVG